MRWAYMMSFFKKSKYVTSKSFFGKTRVALALIGIIPFLLVVYLFFCEKIILSNLTILISATVLFSILVGFSILRKSADQLANLAKSTERIASGKKSESIKINADEELNDIAQNFNSILKEVKEQSIRLRK